MHLVPSRGEQRIYRNNSLGMLGTKHDGLYEGGIKPPLLVATLWYRPVFFRFVEFDVRCLIRA